MFAGDTPASRRVVRSNSLPPRSAIPTCRFARRHRCVDVPRRGHDGDMTSKALIVIDVQEEYFSGKLPIVSSDRMQSLQRIGDAMDTATAAGTPVIVVRHSSNPGEGVFDPDLPTWALRPEVADRPHDVLIDKRLPGSFTGTNLESALREAGVDTVTIAGYMTN